jgi:hypothetical protein
MPLLRRKYKKIDFPDTDWFVTFDRQGVDNGPYEKATFVRVEDGSYVSQGPGSPVFLRCVARDGDWYTVVDGAGARFEYRFDPFERRT